MQGRFSAKYRAGQPTLHGLGAVCKAMSRGLGENSNVLARSFTGVHAQENAETAPRPVGIYAPRKGMW